MLSLTLILSALVLVLSIDNAEANASQPVSVETDDIAVSSRR